MKVLILKFIVYSQVLKRNAFILPSIIVLIRRLDESFHFYSLKICSILSSKKARIF